jgi:DNA polymerase-1
MKELIEKAEKLGIKIPSITSSEIDLAIEPVLRKMEATGIRVDCLALKKLDQKLSLKLKELEKKIFKLAGREFNISSPSQMADVLFVDLKLSSDGIKKTKSGLSTAAAELKKIEASHPVIAEILEYRELSKLISTYLKPLPMLVDENERLHTTYSLETSTGRLTSSEPNLQNIPIRGAYGTEIRRAFIPASGCDLIAADYSQIELRVVACLAQDKAMIEAFKNGEDIHARTAAEIFHIEQNKVTGDQRRKAKAVNFGIVYGQTPYGLSQALGIDVEEAGKYIRDYFDVHVGIGDYINKMIDLAHTKGYVETLFGTRRYLPNINSQMRFVAEAEERMAINMPVQGTAAEILKMAMIELEKKLEKEYPEAKILLTVHDELVLEAPKAVSTKVEQLLKETMENVIKLCVPIEVSTGKGDSWASCK